MMGDPEGHFERFLRVIRVVGIALSSVFETRRSRSGSSLKIKKTSRRSKMTHQSDLLRRRKETHTQIHTKKKTQETEKRNKDSLPTHTKIQPKTTKNNNKKKKEKPHKKKKPNKQNQSKKIGPCFFGTAKKLFCLFTMFLFLFFFSNQFFVFFFFQSFALSYPLLSPRFFRSAFQLKHSERLSIQSPREETREKHWQG